MSMFSAMNMRLNQRTNRASCEASSHLRNDLRWTGGEGDFPDLARRLLRITDIGSIFFHPG